MIEERCFKKKDFSWPLVSIIGKIHLIRCWKHDLLDDGPEVEEMDFTIDDILDEIAADLQTIKDMLHSKFKIEKED